MSRQQTYGSENYKGKNPMSRCQWRRQHRRRKAEREANEKVMEESSTNQPPKKDRGEEKNPVGRKLFPAQKEESQDKSEQLTAGDDMLTNNFDRVKTIFRHQL